MIAEYFNKLDNETYIEAIWYWILHNSYPAKLYNILTRPWYWTRLYKSLIGERYLDYDYISWNIDDSIVDILENTIDIYVENTWCENYDEFIKDTEIVKSDIQIYKNCNSFLNIWIDDELQKTAYKKILDYILKRRKKLWI